MTGGADWLSVARSPPASLSSPPVAEPPASPPAAAPPLPGPVCCSKSSSPSASCLAELASSGL